MICGEVLPEPIAKISHRMVTGRRKQISGITIKHILYNELIIDCLLIGAFRCGHVQVQFCINNQAKLYFKIVGNI